MITQQQHLDWVNNTPDTDLIGKPIHLKSGEISLPIPDATESSNPVHDNSFAMMKVDDTSKSDYILLQFADFVELPRSTDNQITLLELSKSDKPVDVYTRADQGISLKRAIILGSMTYSNGKYEFASDVPMLLSPMSYRVYRFPEAQLDCMLNYSTKNDDVSITLGKYRPTEAFTGELKLDLKAPLRDFLGYRMVVFGQSRSGKSNLAKGIVREFNNVSSNPLTQFSIGQVIFDDDGEWSHDSAQTNSLSGIIGEDCHIFSPTPRGNEESIKTNFYEELPAALEFLKNIIKNENQSLSDYKKNFLSVEIPTIDEIQNMTNGTRLRASRKIMMLYAILHKAGFDVGNTNLAFMDPQFAAELRELAHGDTMPPVRNLDQLVAEFEKVTKFARANRWIDHDALTTQTHNPLFDTDDIALLEFLMPQAQRSGVKLLMPYRKFHDSNASHAIDTILNLLEKGKVVIIDMSTSDEELKNSLIERVCSKIYYSQNEKLKNSNLEKDKYLHVVIEEAQSILFDNDSIIEKLTKQGSKHNIGITFITQSISSIDKKYLDQIQNIFCTNFSSSEEVNFLVKRNSQFAEHKSQLVNVRARGYMRGTTMSTRFIVPFQAPEFV